VAQVVPSKIRPSSGLSCSVRGRKEEAVSAGLCVRRDVLSHHRHQVWGYGDVAGAGCALRGRHNPVSVDSDDTATDTDHAASQVDVVAAQLGQFPEPECAPGREQPIPFRSGRGDDRRQLLEGGRFNLDDAARASGTTDMGRVDDDQLVLGGGGEDGP
jgi:hypothetical protein